MDTDAARSERASERPARSLVAPRLSRGWCRSAHEVEAYRRRRYRLGTQYLLHLREKSIVASALAKAGLDGPAGALARVLDVPCGYGRLLRFAAHELCPAIGVDLSFAQAHGARVHGPTLVTDLLAGLPFADRSFDLVLCVRLFHHLRSHLERIRALRELSRGSRRFVLVSYYGSEPLWRWHRALQESLRRRSRVYVLTEEDLACECQEAELACVARFRVLPRVHAHRFVLLERPLANPRTTPPRRFYTP